jgi:hypothetical protein
MHGVAWTLGPSPFTANSHCYHSCSLCLFPVPSCEYHVPTRCHRLQAHLADAEIWMAEAEYEHVVGATGKLLKSQPSHLEALVLRGSAYFYLNGAQPCAGIC